MFSRQLIQQAQRSVHKYQPVLRSLGSNVIQTEYAVRGAIPLRGLEIKKNLKEGTETKPYDSVTALNIGNPQQVGQGSVTFNREVIAGMTLRSLQTSDAISQDAKNRCAEYEAGFSSPVGAYTVNSKGYQHVREQVAKFIEERDGVVADPECIFLTNGASEGVRTSLQLLLRNRNDGVLIPIPQYPLYSAALTLQGGELLTYYLDEEAGWGLNAEELENKIIQAKEDGFNTRAIVVINPGNPTGQVMNQTYLRQIITLCHEHDILIIADEVYQNNIYYPEAHPFVSMRKVLHEMGGVYSDEVELISMHSVSKGLLGECGMRGGYYELHNMSKKAQAAFLKLKSIELCSNTVGQMAVELMVNPPKRGRESDECVDQYEKEAGGVKNALQEKALMLTECFNSMTNVTCTDIEGAMYGFPRLHFSENFIAKCLKQGKQPDYVYCMDLVEQTGIMTVPGSGFGQMPGTYHFRITNLVTPNERMADVLEKLKVFNEKWQTENA